MHYYYNSELVREPLTYIENHNIGRLYGTYKDGVFTLAHITEEILFSNTTNPFRPSSLNGNRFIAYLQAEDIWHIFEVTKLSLTDIKSGVHDIQCEIRVCED